MTIADRIGAELARIEVEHDVRIILAVESGSRAWGFASTDSDYDVRFIYVHRRDWYLSIDERRDVIELPIVDELDINGWDLRKALKLLRKSNPPLFEWLASPIVYRQWPEAEALRALAQTCYGTRPAFFHYLHMARGNHRAYLQGDEVWLKKYLYVLRPLLALRWIEVHADHPVPLDFEHLLHATTKYEPDLRWAIDKLLALKRAGHELDRGPRIQALSGFIEFELDRLNFARGDAANGVAAAAPDTEALDRFFRATVESAFPRQRPPT